MIKSMTGYGTAVAEAEGKSFSVEIKSVNSRYSDFSIKLPRIYSFLEDPIRKYASERINRGKVDIYVGVTSSGDEKREVKLNVGLAEGYYEALTTLSGKLGVDCRATAETFLRIPDVFEVESVPPDAEKIEEAVLSALGDAICGFDQMRTKEGERLYADLKEHLEFIKNATAEVERRSPEIVKEYRAKIENRMRELLENTPVDEGRLLTETAIFADRINVNEETVRLRSHTQQFEEILESEGAVGRKIDFLIQEMNREINTIGSKSNDLQIARIVIDVKAEIEKLREQIQNVE